MIYFLVLAVTLSSVLSVLSLGIMDVIYSSQKTIAAQTEKAQLNQVTVAISHSLRRIGANQDVVAPVGVGYSNANDINGDPIYKYQTLPRSVGASHINKFGLAYLYCPVSKHPIDFTLPLEDVNLTSKDFYSVGTVKNENGDSYVAQSDSILDPSIDSNEVIALIASLFGSETIVSCRDITYSRERNIYSIDNGVVSAITKDSLNKLSYSEDIVIDFANKDANYSINDAFASWSVMKPRKLTLLLPYNVEPYKLNGNVRLFNDAAENDMSVTIKYKGDNVTKSQASIIASGNSLFELDGVNLKIENIEMNGAVQLKSFDANVVVDGSRIGDVNIENGSLILKNGVEIMSSYPSIASIDAYNSKIQVVSGGVSIGAQYAPKTGIRLVGSSLTNKSDIRTPISIDSKGKMSSAISLANSSRFACDSCSIESTAKSGDKLNSAISVDQTSTLSLFKSTLTTAPSLYGIYSKGNVISDQSTISFGSGTNFGIQITGGGRATLNSSMIGFPFVSSGDAIPSIAISDNGGSFISGNDTSIRAASSCWEGPIFSYKSGAKTGMSDATDSTYKIFNQSSWHCNK